MHTILILQKDISLAQEMAERLERKGLFVVVCHFLESAIRKTDQYDFDVAVVGDVLPDGEGLEMVEYLNDSSFRTRCLLTSKKVDFKSRVTYLKKGVDAILLQPFSLLEFSIRVDQLRFRRKVWERDCLTLKDGLQLFPDEGVLQRSGKSKVLRRRESQILHCLLLHKNRVVTREMLFKWVWGNTDLAPKNITLDVYVKRVRLALGKDSVLLETVRGFGYRLNSVLSSQLYPKLVGKGRYQVGSTQSVESLEKAQVLGGVS